MSNPATPLELEALLGDLDPLAVEQILLTGASAEEAAVALACVEAERNGDPSPPMSPRVASVYAILDETFDELDGREEDAAVAAGTV